MSYRAVPLRALLAALPPDAGDTIQARATANPGRLAEALGPYVETAGEQQQILRRAGEVAACWSELAAAQLRPAIATLCRLINLHSERIDIEISRRGLYAFLRGERAESRADEQPDHQLLLSFSTRLCRIGQGKRLVVDAAVRPGMSGRPDPKLIKLLVRGHCLKEKLREIPGTRIADLAMREKLSPSYVALLLRLTFLAPDITRAILDGRQPGGFTAQKIPLGSSIVAVTRPSRGYCFASLTSQIHGPRLMLPIS
jgi:site-specific DNA recombinase